MKRSIVGLLLLITACGTTSRQGVPTPATQVLPHAAPDPRGVAPTGPPSNVYVFRGVDLFGVHEAARQRVLGLISMPTPGTRVDPSQQEFIDPLIASKKRVLEDAPYPFCRFTVDQWLSTHELYLTVNVVEPGEEWRMRFSADPTQDVPDPEGLLAAWRDYQKRFWELRRQGAVPEYGNGGDACHALLCHGGFAHPELAPLEQRFIDGVPRNTDTLVRMLREDRDAGKRLLALMLLSYVPSREELVQISLPSVRDPDESVRNEALQLLGVLQQGQPRALIPLDTVLEALWYPLTSERNKALWALVRLLETEGGVHRQHILERSGAALLEMLDMKSRLEHEPAHDAFALLAGRDLGEDVGAWRQWMAEQRAAPADKPMGASSLPRP